MKKVLSFIFAIVMTVSCFSIAFCVSAAEAGTLPSNAIVLKDDEFYTKYWTYSNYKLNCYNKITIPARGFITLTLEKPFDDEGEMCGYNLKLVDVNGKDVWNCDTGAQIDSFSEYFVYKVGLNKGTYFLNVDPDFFVYRNSAPIAAAYKYSFTANNYWEIEPNNTQDCATVLEFDKMYSGVYTDEAYGSTFVDYYSVSLTKGAEYVIKVENYEALDVGTLILSLVKPSGQEDTLVHETVQGTTASFKITATTTGTHYIKFDNDGNDAGVEYKVGISRNMKSISSKKVKLSPASCVYDGKEKKPKVTISGLRNGTDFTVSYANNKAIGQATATITGKGNYYGKKTVSFKIVPNKVSGMKVSRTTNSITLSWNKVAGAKSYNVYSYASGKYKKIATVKTNKATIKSLSAGKKYSYAVEAVANSIAGQKSSLIKTATKPAAPKISKLSTNCAWVEIEWKKVSGAAEYEVYMSKSKNGKYKKIDTTYSTDTTVFDLDIGRVYYFKVRAYTEVNEKKIYGDFSAVKSIKVKY